MENWEWIVGTAIACPLLSKMNYFVGAHSVRPLIDRHYGMNDLKYNIAAEQNLWNAEGGVPYKSWLFMQSFVRALSGAPLSKCAPYSDNK